MNVQSDAHVAAEHISERGTTRNAAYEVATARVELHFYSCRQYTTCHTICFHNRVRHPVSKPLFWQRCFFLAGSKTDKKLVFDVPWGSPRGPSLLCECCQLNRLINELRWQHLGPKGWIRPECNLTVLWSPPETLRTHRQRMQLADSSGWLYHPQKCCLHKETPYVCLLNRLIVC